MYDFWYVADAKGISKACRRVVRHGVERDQRLDWSERAVQAEGAGSDSSAQLSSQPDSAEPEDEQDEYVRDCDPGHHDSLLSEDYSRGGVCGAGARIFPDCAGLGGEPYAGGGHDRTAARAAGGGDFAGGRGRRGVVAGTDDVAYFGFAGGVPRSTA